MQETWVWFLCRSDTLKWQPTPVFLFGESHGVRSLAGYSPWGCKELNMTEGLTHAHIPFVKADPEKSFIEIPDSSVWADSHYFRPGDISQTLPACRSYTVCFGLIWLILLSYSLIHLHKTPHASPPSIPFHLILCPPEMADLYIFKQKSWHPVPSLHGKWMRKKRNQWETFISLGSKNHCRWWLQPWN